MDEQKRDDQLEPTYNSSVPIPDIDLKTCRKQGRIEMGGEKGSGISEMMARHDDIYLSIYTERERDKHKKKLIYIKKGARVCVCVCVCVCERERERERERAKWIDTQIEKYIGIYI